MKRFNTTAAFTAACTGLAFYGVAMLSLGPILGPLNRLVEGANALPSTMSLGIILGTVLFGPIVDRSGYKSLMVISSILALAGLQGLARFQDIVLLHVSIFLLGFGGGMLNGATNALTSDLYDDGRRGGRLGFLGACYGIGALLWSLLNYFIPDYRIPLNAVSVVMGLCIVAYCFIVFPPAKPKENVSLAKSVGLLKYPALILFAFILFFQSVFEATSGNFTVQYLDKAGGMENAAAILSMTWFTAGMLAGRLPLGLMMKKLGDVRTLYCYLSIGLAGVVLFFMECSEPAVVYTAMALIGLGMGATFPVVLNFIGGAFSRLSGTAFSIALFIGLIGQSLGNRLVGLQFDAGVYRALPAALIASLLAMMLIVPLAVRAARKMGRRL